MNRLIPYALSPCHPEPRIYRCGNTIFLYWVVRRPYSPFFINTPWLPGGIVHGRDVFRQIARKTDRVYGDGMQFLRYYPVFR